jgi:hypothetical protein
VIHINEFYNSEKEVKCSNYRPNSYLLEDVAGVTPTPSWNNIPFRPSSTYHLTFFRAVFHI